MDELFTIFLIVVFVVLPMLEAVLKHRKGGGEADEAPRERAPGPPERAPGAPDRAPGRTAGEEPPRRSEGMIPPDIWEELTGLPAPGRGPEAEAPPRPEDPAPPEVPGRPEPARGAGVRARPETPPADPRPRAAPGRDALPVARDEIGEGGEAGSLVPTGEGRSAARGAAGPGHPSGRRVRRTPAGRLVAGLAAGPEGPDGAARVRELRRAVVYREVLGPPLALRRGPGAGGLEG